jgi:hypothetical protein
LLLIAMRGGFRSISLLFPAPPVSCFLTVVAVTGEAGILFWKAEKFTRPSRHFLLVVISPDDAVRICLRIGDVVRGPDDGGTGETILF